MSDLTKWLQDVPVDEALMAANYNGNLYHAVFRDRVGTGVTGLTLQYIFNRCGDDVTDDVNESVIDFLFEQVYASSAQKREDRLENQAMDAYLEGKL